MKFHRNHVRCEKTRRTTSRGARRLPTWLESLEPRVALHGEGPLSATDRYFTLSFAPDGADVGEVPNTLSANWMPSSPRQTGSKRFCAFQTWASETSIDVGWVEEIGTLPFGAQGPRSGDARFGDVRVGARPLAPDTLAISVSQDAVLSGTWAADVVFNSAAAFQSLDDLFVVALHEAGHVFGMSHSDDPSSPMHVHGVGEATALTATDISQVRRNYGSRLPDVWEGSGGNETLKTAVHVEPIEIADDLSGSGPAIVMGNLHRANDVDVYTIETIDDYTGPLTITVDTAGTSLLQAKLTLMTSDGSEVAVRSNTGLFGKSLQYTLPHVRPDENYFVRVEAATDDVFSLGGYVLTASFDDELIATSQQIEDVVRSRLRLSPDEIESLLADTDEYLNADGGSDDSEGDAAELQASGEFLEVPRYRVTGSVESATDVDVYRIKSPKTSAGLSAMRVTVRSLQEGGLIPSVRILDEDKQEAATTVLVNGGGELVVQVDSIRADRDYHVSIAPSQRDRFSAGAYQLAIEFTAEPTRLRPFVEGAVSGVNNASPHRLYIATPQLFHFALTTDQATTTGGSGVMLLVLSDTGRIVHQLTSPAGQTRTNGSVFMAPGAYVLLAMPLYESPADAAIVLSYHVTGDVVSDPFAVDPVVPSDAEFQCPDLKGLFCYPGEIVSPDPFIWLDFLDQLPAIPDLSGTELQSALLGDWWNWYWQQQGNNVPPLARGDAYVTSAGSTLAVDTLRGVLANDSDPDSSEMTVQLLEPPAHGTLLMKFDGSFVYQPNAGFLGFDRFVYAAYDFRSVSSPTTAVIDVQGGLLRGDFTSDGLVDELDVNALATAMQTSRDAAFDLNGDQQLDGQDWQVMVTDILNTSFGDANLDGAFNSSDLILVFQAGEFEDLLSGNSSWRSGDWNGDGDFDTSDLVFALQWGGFE